MEDTAEDSDATVAGDELEECKDNQLKNYKLKNYTDLSVCETQHTSHSNLDIPSEGHLSDNNETGPSSPSLLQSVQHLTLGHATSSHKVTMTKLGISKLTTGCGLDDKGGKDEKMKSE